MPEKAQPRVGSIAWVDLTIPEAASVGDFYTRVVGWRPQGIAMGDYEDFVMAEPASGTPVAGVCNARGENLGLPPVWLVYFTVENLEASLAECRVRGGTVLRDVTSLGASGRYAVIGDPAGAIAALIEPA